MRVFLIAVIVLWTALRASAGLAQQSSPPAWEAWKQQVRERLASISPRLGEATLKARLAVPNEARMLLTVQVASVGQIIAASVDRGSGFPDLDQLAIRLIRKVGPLPRMPAGAPHRVTLKVPIAFLGFSIEADPFDLY